jgi:hypothetical protein
MAALLGIVALTFVVCVGYYVWYGFALARLFPKIGGEGWKGWVPILNEAEILARGGVPGWSVVFYFIPVLQLYGLYLKAMAVQRINLQFGRGVGMAILGILLPPVWATVLAASHHDDTGEFERRVASITPTRPDQATGPLAAASPLSPAQVTDASGYAVFSAGTASSANAVQPPAPPTPPSSSTESPVPPAPPAPPSPPPVPPTSWVVEEAPTPAPAAPTNSNPGFIENPWVAAEATPPPATAEIPPVAPALVEPARAATARPIMDFPRITPLPGAPREPVEEPIRQVAKESAVPTSEPKASPAVPIVAPAAAPASDDDDFDETVVVDRRPRVAWSLALDDGRTFPLSATEVALGRNPSSSDAAVQLLPIPDTTRTLSKTHARLTLDDGQWTITDLGSTNGVLVVGADDVETLLEPSEPTVLTGRFILGKVGMRIDYERPALT